MLLNNPNNRKLEKKRVERFAEMMRRGVWLENGASIVMNGTMLLDGQHRLSAVIASGVSLPMVVVRDVPTQSFSTIDTGKSRTLADYLGIEGFSHAATLASAIRQFSALRSGLSIANAYSPHKTAMTYEELSQMLTDYPQIKRSVEYIFMIDAKPPMQPATLAALHALFSEKAPILADRYITRITAGTNLEPGSVEASVYGRLLSRSLGQSRRLRPVEKTYLVIKGWNMLRRDEPMRGWIRVQAGKGGAIKMPEIE